jgi:dTDP-4-dehydrorhamnose reductase
MNILLIGKRGQLGWELNRTLVTLGPLVALEYPEIDLSQPAQLRNLVREYRPQIIVNAAAYTAVDQAEAEPELAFRINQDAPAALAEAARSLDAALIHYSTDYVFDGRKKAPYLETDATNPLNVYGKSKLAGEQAITASNAAYLILRTSWVYSLRRSSFVTKVLEWSRTQQILRVVDDQVSGPTWCRSLAEITAQVLSRGGDNPVTWLDERSGIYHLAGEGYASRLEWAQAILRYDPHPEEQQTQALHAARSQDFPTAAERPAYSMLNTDRFFRTFGLRLPDWRQSLELAMAEDCE